MKIIFVVFYLTPFRILHYILCYRSFKQFLKLFRRNPGKVYAEGDANNNSIAAHLSSAPSAPLFNTNNNNTTYLPPFPHVQNANNGDFAFNPYNSTPNLNNHDIPFNDLPGTSQGEQVQVAHLTKSLSSTNSDLYDFDQINSCPNSFPSDDDFFLLPSEPSTLTLNSNPPSEIRKNFTQKHQSTHFVYRPKPIRNRIKLLKKAIGKKLPWSTRSSTRYYPVNHMFENETSNNAPIVTQPRSQVSYWKLILTLPLHLG